MKRCAIYTRVSTLDQHPETQLIELRAVARQRGYEIVGEFTDHGVSGAKAKRPALDKALLEVRHARVDVVTIIGAFAELERSLIIERVRTGMRRAKLEGRRLGRPRLNLDRRQILLDHARGMSLSEIATAHHISRTTVRRVLGAAAPKGSLQTASQLQENRQPETAA